MADREEEIKMKNQQAAEAMQRAKQAQLENARMQRELQAAARELARHQELAKKMAMQQGAARETAASRQTVEQSGTTERTVSSDALMKQQEASREAARQAMIYEAAKRRAEKKQAAKRAAELVAKQKAAEAKIHHTSPETKELQNLLLQQIADIMEEEPSADAETKQPAKPMSDAGAKHAPKPASDAKAVRKTKPVQQGEKDTASVPMAEEGFGDLVIMDVHGREQAPESSATIEEGTEKPQEVSGDNPRSGKEEKLERWGQMGIWFQTFCWMHIPIIGFWYMVVVAIRKKSSPEKRAFARAYVLYRILVLLLALTILYIFYRMGLSFVEQILMYIDAH